VLGCALVSACNSGGSALTTAPTAAQVAVVAGMSFSSTPAPTTQYANGDPNAAYNMSIPYTTSQVTVIYSDGTTATHPLEHNFLFKSSDLIPSGPYTGQYYGGIIDINGNPVNDPASILANPQFVSDTPDGSALMKVSTGTTTSTSDTLYFINHFEYVTWDTARASQYGKNPMFMGLSTVTQDLSTGLLALQNYTKINLTADHGLWIPCAASLSPWNTFLGSEEYEPDEWNYDMNGIDPVNNPLNFSNGNLVQAFQTKYQDPLARPYNYGYVTEVTLDQVGQPTTVKHYASGRWARELIRVMPDGKTFYSGDDGKSTTLFMGVADVPNNLSAGITLYAAKFTQTSAPGSPLGSGNLQWINLGHANDLQIKTFIDAGIQFAQIFDLVLESTGGTLPTAVAGVTGTGVAGAVTPVDMVNAGYRRVFNYYHPVSKGKAEWLRLKTGMEIPAAFLETHRYAAYVGATTEFTKMEGVALDQARKKTYVAISYQYKSMSDGTGDIQFGKMVAGETYEIAMAANQTDSLGVAINSSWAATTFSAVPELLGQDNAPDPITGKRSADAQGNLCAVNAVANPDNLKFSDMTETLFIGEDSNCHVNNFVWAFNVVTRQLSRILSIPMGAEATGLMAVDNMNGYMYIGSNYQHPGDNGVGAPPAAVVAAVEAANPTFAADRNRAGGIGYIRIKGMPKM